MARGRRLIVGHAPPPAPVRPDGQNRAIRHESDQPATPQTRRPEGDLLDYSLSDCAAPTATTQLCPPLSGCAFVVVALTLDDSASLNDAHKDDDDCDNEEDVNQTAHRVSADHTQQP